MASLEIGGPLELLQDTQGFSGTPVENQWANKWCSTRKSVLYATHWHIHEVIYGLSRKGTRKNIQKYFLVFLKKKINLLTFAFKFIIYFNGCIFGHSRTFSSDYCQSCLRRRKIEKVDLHLLHFLSSEKRNISFPSNILQAFCETQMIYFYHVFQWCR